MDLALLLKDNSLTNFSSFPISEEPNNIVQAEKLEKMTQKIVDESITFLDPQKDKVVVFGPNALIFIKKLYEEFEARGKEFQMFFTYDDISQLDQRPVRHQYRDQTDGGRLYTIDSSPENFDLYLGIYKKKEPEEKF